MYLYPALTDSWYIVTGRRRRRRRRRCCCWYIAEYSEPDGRWCAYIRFHRDSSVSARTCFAYELIVPPRWLFFFFFFSLCPFSTPATVQHTPTTTQRRRRRRRRRSRCHCCRRWLLSLRCNIAALLGALTNRPLTPDNTVTYSLSRSLFIFLSFSDNSKRLKFPLYRIFLFKRRAIGDYSARCEIAESFASTCKDEEAVFYFEKRVCSRWVFAVFGSFLTQLKKIYMRGKRN